MSDRSVPGVGPEAHGWARPFLKPTPPGTPAASSVPTTPLLAAMTPPNGCSEGTAGSPACDPPSTVTTGTTCAGATFTAICSRSTIGSSVEKCRVSQTNLQRRSRTTAITTTHLTSLTALSTADRRYPDRCSTTPSCPNERIPALLRDRQHTPAPGASSRGPGRERPGRSAHCFLAPNAPTALPLWNPAVNSPATLPGCGVTPLLSTVSSP